MITLEADGGKTAQPYTGITFKTNDGNPSPPQGGGVEGVFTSGQIISGWTAGEQAWNQSWIKFQTHSSNSSSLVDDMVLQGGNLQIKGNITAYYSDERLKTFKGKITDPIEKIKQLNGYYFVENELAKSLGYNNNKLQVGVSAQEVEKVLPEIVTEAPIDKKYKTVWYEKTIPLLIEGIKEQQKEIDTLKKMVNDLMKK